MKNFIIGTAGHIDHGKTSLIKALTGIDTDRLKEEKKRGISIDLGFSYFNLPKGQKAGIIDVPGHEKFIKNMLAGVGGMDMVLMVIAADEGIMPQTREHFDILTNLNISHGVIVLTKIDLVEPEWLQMVEDEIRKEMTKDFLVDAKIIKVSSMTGEGIGELKQEIESIAEIVSDKNIDVPFRVPIDRVFTVGGFGTVITGTQIEGILNKGDEVSIYPSQQVTKVRNIQVHGKNVEQSVAGQRVAINLANVKKEELNRGFVLSKSNTLEDTMMLDVRLNMLKNAKRILKNRTRLRVYHGTSETMCRVVLLNKEEVKSGETCLAQLRLEEKIAVKSGDHYVVRFYSPLETVGGGVILDANPYKHKRFDEKVIADLMLRAEGSDEEIVETIIRKYSESYRDVDYIVNQFGKEKDKTLELINQLVDQEKIILLEDRYPIHQAMIKRLEKKAIDTLELHHKEKPLEKGMNIEEFRNKLFGKNKQHADVFLAYFDKNKILDVQDLMVSYAGFKIEYSKEQLRIKNKLEQIYIQGRLQVPSIKDVLSEFKNKDSALTVIGNMVNEGQLVKLDASFYLYRENYEKALEIMYQYIRANGTITLAQYRDAIRTSRKYALLLLEYFDKLKITKKVDDARVLISL